jgi:ornithine cyclodeaminase
VFRGEWLTTGATILTIGSYAPDLNEIDLLVSSRASRTFVDDIDKASKWCGPVISAISGGLLKLEEIAAIGDFIGSGHLARQSHEEILVFHSVGVAAQDAALSWMIYERALSQGLGARVEF